MASRCGFICISPTSDLEHLVRSLAMCVLSLEKCLQESFVLFGGCWVSTPLHVSGVWQSVCRAHRGSVSPPWL